MKRFVALLLAMVSILCLAACGSSKSIAGISEKTTLSQAKAMTSGKIKEGKNIMDEDYFLLEGGGTFAELSVDYLLVVGTEEKGTIKCIELDGIYAGSNKDLVDELLVSMSKNYGSPDTEHRKGATYDYVLYTWDGGTDYEKQIRISEQRKSFSFVLNY